MSELLKHLHIFQADPTDDFVEKRLGAIKDIKTGLEKKKTRSDMVDLARAVALGFSSSLPPDIAAEAEAKIQKHSSSFHKDGQDLQLATCVHLACLSILKAAKTSASFNNEVCLAWSLYSALSFQSKIKNDKVEALRQEIIAEAGRLLEKHKSTNRDRADIPDILIEETEVEGGSAELDLEEVNEQLKSTIDALRDNASLDREELDLLWWHIANYSEIYQSPLSSLTIVKRGISAGIEAGALMRRLPTTSHKRLLFRLLDDNPSYPLKKILSAVELGTDLNEQYLGSFTFSNTDVVFPVLSSLVTGESDLFGAGEERTMQEWLARAYSEASFVRVFSTEDQN